MSEKLPTITAFKPIVLPDKRRVMLDLVVDNLPTLFSNVAFTMPGLAETGPPQPTKPDPDAPSPYPDVELSIWDSQQREVANLYIVEHKERHTSLTLHLRRPDETEQYTARATMTHQDQLLDSAEAPFTLE